MLHLLTLAVGVLTGVVGADGGLSCDLGDVLRLSCTQKHIRLIPTLFTEGEAFLDGITNVYLIVILLFI